MSPHESPQLSQDTAFDLLSNVRRRFVLRRLQDRPEGVELSALAEQLAAEENDAELEELSAQQRKRTYVSLYQTHIPKLADAGVVEYDPDTGMVYPTHHVDELSQYFEEGDPGVRWQLVYGAVVAGGVFLYVLELLIDLPFFDARFVGLTALGTIAVVSATHYIYAKRIRTTPEIPVSR